MGESKTLGPFVKACDQFKYLDLILGHQDEDAAPNATDTAEAAALAQAGDDTAINRDSVARLVRGMIDEMDDGTGWVRTRRSATSSSSVTRTSTCATSAPRA